MGELPNDRVCGEFNHLGVTGCFSASSRIPKGEIERRGYYFVMGNGGNPEWHTDDDLMPEELRDFCLAIGESTLQALIDFVTAEGPTYTRAAAADTLAKLADAYPARPDCCAA